MSAGLGITTGRHYAKISKVLVNLLHADKPMEPYIELRIKILHNWKWIHYESSAKISITGTLRYYCERQGTEWIRFASGLTGTITLNGRHCGKQQQNNRRQRRKYHTLKKYGLKVANKQNVVIAYMKFTQMEGIDPGGAIRVIEKCLLFVQAAEMTATKDMRITDHNYFFDQTTNRMPLCRRRKFHLFNNYHYKWSGSNCMEINDCAQLLSEGSIYYLRESKAGRAVTAAGDALL